MSSTEHTSDPLFWPFLFVALIVALFVWGFVTMVKVLARRDAGHHPQQAMGGSNFHDASSHSTTTIGKINVKVEKPGAEG